MFARCFCWCQCWRCLSVLHVPAAAEGQRRLSVITIWSFVMLGLVLLPCGILALFVWNTWISGVHPAENRAEQDHHV
jgi:hypothetical protein